MTAEDTPNMAGSSVMRRAMHMLDCQDAVAMAITNWARVMEMSRLEAARQVLKDSKDPEGGLPGHYPWPDPDLIEAAKKALRKEMRAAR